MKDFFDRLDMYMNYSCLNDNKLTVMARLSIGALGKQRKGSRGLSVDSIAKILHSCPDLNADWLLTGRGNMLTDQSPQKAEPKEVIIYRSDPKDLEIIELQREHIKMLKEQQALSPARLDLNVPSTESTPTPIPSFARPKRAKNHPKPH